jgi:hypothetical protein
MNGAAGGSRARSPSKRLARRLVNIVGQQRGHSARVSVGCPNSQPPSASSSSRSGMVAMPMARRRSLRSHQGLGMQESTATPQQMSRRRRVYRAVSRRANAWCRVAI